MENIKPVVQEREMVVEKVPFEIISDVATSSSKRFHMNTRSV